MTTFTTDDRIHAEKDGSFTLNCRQKPLSDEQIIVIWGVASIWDDKLIKFARAIEKAHGIV